MLSVTVHRRPPRRRLTAHSDVQGMWKERKAKWILAAGGKQPSY